MVSPTHTQLHLYGIIAFRTFLVLEASYLQFSLDCWYVAQWRRKWEQKLGYRSGDDQCDYSQTSKDCTLGTWNLFRLSGSVWSHHTRVRTLRIPDLRYFAEFRLASIDDYCCHAIRGVIMLNDTWNSKYATRGTYENFEVIDDEFDSKIVELEERKQD